MAALTQTEPDVLTDHTDVICSTSIERIVTGRNVIPRWLYESTTYCNFYSHVK
jgi:hypothetical protein